MYRDRGWMDVPPDDAKVWRYMDLSLFLWLLAKKSLYFASLNEFEDQWEGTIPADWIAARKQVYRDMPFHKGDIKHRVRTSFDRYKRAQKYFAFSCWHEGDTESIAMWKLYTHGLDGVAIQTTVGKLKNSLSSEERDFSIGRVEYRDHEKLGGKAEPHRVLFMMRFRDLLSPLMIKRPSYRHESEVRLILDRTQRQRDPGKALRVVSAASEKTWQRGEAVKVDLPLLIERIVVSPMFPKWATQSLQRSIRRAKVNIKVERSDLLRRPKIYPRVWPSIKKDEK